MMKSVVIAINYVEYQDSRRRIAQDVALQVLSSRPKMQIYVVSLGFPDSSRTPLFKECRVHHLPILKRDSSKTINNHKRLPYVKEILDSCYSITCDVFGYINSDILIPNEVYSILQMDFDAFIFSRSDIGEISASDFIDGKQRVISGGNTHSGADGFFFSKAWWDCNRKNFHDDLIVGASDWDTVYRHIIKKSSCRFLEARVLYHVFHSQVWTTGTRDAQNNIKIWNSIKDKKVF